MKVLFIAGASSATLFALAPLATAVRNAGHEAVLASTEEMVPVAERTGVPFISVTDRTLAGLLSTDRLGQPVPTPSGLAEELRYAGSWFGRLAAASIDELLEFAAIWRPDLVVGGTMSYAASLVSAHCGVPHVRHAWDAQDTREVDPYADEELAPELAVLGLDRLPAPDLFIEICPPSVRSPSAGPAQLMRWIPGNRQGKLEQWMYVRGGGQRVCVTSGSRVSVTKSLDFLRGLAGSVSVLDAEILVAAPDDVAPDLRERLPDLRIGWIPLDIVAPTCDLIVHHGGGVTSMTAMNSGIPQLVLPRWNIFRDSWDRVAEFGASINLSPGADTEDNIAKACHELLTNPSYRDRARTLSGEISALPGPAELVGVLERLAAG